MNSKIPNEGNYPVIDFENYYLLQDNLYLTKSYFYNNVTNESMCEWHVAELIPENSFFTIKERLGSSYIHSEIEDLDFWRDYALNFLQKSSSTESESTTDTTTESTTDTTVTQDTSQ